MKKLIFIIILLFTTTGCSTIELNNFFDKISNLNSSYLLVITVNDSDTNIIEVNNDIAHAYEYKDNKLTKEIYFTNLKYQYETYIKIDDSWKKTTLNKYYDDYFGLINLKNVKFEKDKYNNCYKYDYNNATFKIDLEYTKVTLINNETQEYVIYNYDFSITPNVIKPFSINLF